MFSKRELEGELTIDHRESPGVPLGLAEQYQRDHPLMDVPMQACQGGKLYETAILVCSHCGVTIIRGPQWESANHWCSGCDRYVCNVCKFLKTGCYSMGQRLDEVSEALVTHKPLPDLGPLITLTDS